MSEKYVSINYLIDKIGQESHPIKSGDNFSDDDYGLTVFELMKLLDDTDKIIEIS